MTMNGYEPTPEEIQIVLKHLKAIRPESTEEDALRILLKTKVDIREVARTNPDRLPEEVDKLISEIYGG